MLKMSFYNGTLDKDVLIDNVISAGKPILYTFGYTWKHPTIYKRPVSVEKAISIIEKEDFLDATEYVDHIHLNAFSGNDLW